MTLFDLNIQRLTTMASSSIRSKGNDRVVNSWSSRPLKTSKSNSDVSRADPSRDEEVKAAIDDCRFDPTASEVDKATSPAALIPCSRRCAMAPEVVCEHTNRWP
jgi:hypothetical protein